MKNDCAKPKNLNAHIVLNNYSPDIRVEKETLAISDLRIFDKIVIIALNKENTASIEELDKFRIVHRINLKTKDLPKRIPFQLIKYFELKRKIINYYKDKNLKIIHCHDLNTLPIGVKLKKKTGANIIYDAHELETERTGLRGIKKLVLKIVEKTNINKVDEIITVGNLIAEWYKNKYSLNNVHVIRNIPYDYDTFYRNTVNIRKKYGIEDEKILFVFCGRFYYTRGIDYMINLFGTLGDKFHLILFGKGPLENLVIHSSENYNNIHYGGFVEQKMLLYYLKQADIGINVRPEIKYLNQKYSLPNKIFQYIKAELPILISDFEEINQYISKFDIGWKIKGDPEDFIRTINKEQIKQKKLNIKKYLKNFSWDTEKEILKKIYLNNL